MSRTEETRRSWNLATRAHNTHKRDQAAFLRDGGSTLFPEEVELLGDLRGKKLLHLLCNSGQDTLSLAGRHGAEVTGVDISDEAVSFARTLATGSGIPATFVRSDVYEWLREAGRGEARFDVAFVSYGAIPWLVDFEGWARGVAGVLSPGGRLVGLEFHPLVWSFDATFRAAVDDYFSRGPFSEPVKDYVARSGGLLAPSGFVEGDPAFANSEVAHAFQWTVGDIVTGLARAGFVVEELREYPFANGCRLNEGLVEAEGRRLVPPPGVARVPLMLGFSARLPR